MDAGDEFFTGGEEVPTAEGAPEVRCPCPCLICMGSSSKYSASWCPMPWPAAVLDGSTAVPPRHVWVGCLALLSIHVVRFDWKNATRCIHSFRVLLVCFVFCFFMSRGSSSRVLVLMSGVRVCLAGFQSVFCFFVFSRTRGEVNKTRARTIDSSRFSGFLFLVLADRGTYHVIPSRA